MLLVGVEVDEDNKSTYLLNVIQKSKIMPLCKSACWKIPAEVIFEPGRGGCNCEELLDKDMLVGRLARTESGV